MDIKMMNPFKHECVVNGDDFEWGAKQDNEAN